MNGSVSHLLAHPFSCLRDGIGAESTENIETVIIHDVDLELLRRHRLNGSVTNLKDRRLDLYDLRAIED